MKPEVKRELDRLKSQSPNGRLTVDIVLEAARDKKSPLHADFTWDAQAALRRNLEAEARELIREYYVVITTPAGPVKMRHYVSLREDRIDGGGYRTIAEVLDDEALTEQLLHDALADLAAIQQRYNRIEQLAGVFKEIAKVREKYPPRPKRGRPSTKGRPEVRAA